MTCDYGRGLGNMNSLLPSFALEQSRWHSIAYCGSCLGSEASPALHGNVKELLTGSGLNDDAVYPYRIATSSMITRAIQYKSINMVVSLLPFFFFHDRLTVVMCDLVECNHPFSVSSFQSPFVTLV